MSKSKATTSVLDNLDDVSDRELAKFALMAFVEGMRRLTDKQDDCKLAGEILGEIIKLLAEKGKDLTFSDVAVVTASLTLMITAEYLEELKGMNSSGLFTAAKQSGAVN